MSGNGVDRELSISSERTLDNLETLNSPIHSPNLLISEYKMKRINPDLSGKPGFSRPPHHSRMNDRDDNDDDDGDVSDASDKVVTRVSWQPPDSTEYSMHPDGTPQVTSQFMYDYNGGQPVSPSQSPQKARSDITAVQIGSDFSPVRRLKRKEEDRPTMEREYSDAYLDSVTRTPRYELGRHNTYDEILTSMNPEDPFKGQYEPSGKMPREKSKIPKPGKKSKHREDSTLDPSYLPMESIKSRKRTKKKKKKGDDSLTSTGTFTYDSHVNSGYMNTPVQTKTFDPERSSMTSNGTYTLGDKEKLMASHGVPTRSKRIFKNATSHLRCEMNEFDKRKEIDRDELIKFIDESRIMQLECRSYAPDNKSPDGNCYCGRNRSWHIAKNIDVPDISNSHKSQHIWHSKTHAGEFPTRCFGEIQFHGFGQETYSSPYIRLSPTTNLEDMFTLLTEHWKLPIPKLLISVTGGAQRFDLGPRLKAVFKRGLINAATSTGAWIITGGTATGVMQFVGEAVRDHLITLGNNDNPVVALGIATWGCVANREALDGELEPGLFPANYSLDEVSEVKGKDVPLDHNHTHFILVDDGREGKFGGEIMFRSMLERHVSEKVETGLSKSQSVNVPLVMLVVEGGVNTMKTVFQAAQQNIPILVLNGSGRAADFIALGYQLSKDFKNEDKSVFRQGFDEEMKAIAREKFAWKASDNVDKKIAECLKQLKDSLDKRRLLNVFNLNEADTNDIDRAILYALLKANKTNAQVQLSLALAWTRCDIARHEIFTQENRQHWKNIPLYDAMVTALVQDRVDFVQLFCENGVNLQKFLSIDTLWNLYAMVLSETSPMNQLVNNTIQYLEQSWASYLLCREDDVSNYDPDLLRSVGRLMVHLLGDENMNLYNDDKYIVQYKNPQMRWLPGNHASNNKNLSAHVSDVLDIMDQRPSIYDVVDSARKFFNRKQKKYDFNNLAERELFLWAILTNRRELGKMFWKTGQDQLGSALLGCALLKALAKKADVDEELELSLSLMEHANMYEDMAVGVLSECYQKEKNLAHQLLVRQLHNYGRTTLFSLADTFSMMKFMGTTCCQTKLNLIWKGRMALYTQSWKIVLSLFCPVFIPTIKFTTEKTNKAEFDKLTEGEEMTESKKEEVQVISNKVMPSGEVEEEVFVRSNTRRHRNKMRKLFSVRMFSDRDQNRIGVMSAIYFFYTAPVTVFITNTLSYLVFLAIFTYFILTDLHPDKVSTLEYVTWGWTITMFLEEARQIASTDRRSLWYKVRNWFDSLWNRFDLAMYNIFILSVIMRFVLRGEDFVYARVLYSVTLAMYYMRFMQTFFVEKNMGPKVIMIKNMLVDLMFFVGIFIVFMLSFGVMYQANLYPNSPPSWYLLKSVIYIPYWQMYGELFLEDMEGEHPDSCTTNESIWRPGGGVDRCPEKNALVPLLAAAYLIMTNILLVNLLIAMFSNTFQIVQDRSEQVWRYFRYGLVYEFYDRPVFCPPLIILAHMYRLMLWVYRNKCKGSKYSNEFRLKLDEKDNNKLTVFERTATENYLNITQKAQKEELSTKVADTATRIDKVIEELENIKDSVRISKVTDDLSRTALLDQPPETVPVLSARSPLPSRRQPGMNMNVQFLQEQIADLGDQVAKTNLQNAQLMQMLQMLMSNQQAQQRPQHLEIIDMSRMSQDNTET